MNGTAASDDAPEATNGQVAEEHKPSARWFLKRGVPRWVALAGCFFLIIWGCVKLYDHQHAAAPAARGLWSVKASDRILAIRELEGTGRVDTAVAIPALSSALEDTDGEVRAAAAMALVSVVPGTNGAAAPTGKVVRAVVRALVKCVKDPQPSVRAAATKALWMVILVNPMAGAEADFEPATSALIERLDDLEPAVRLSAIQGLGMLGPKILGDPPARLVAVMEDESDQMRDAAIEALASFRHGLPPLVPSLVRAAERAEPRARAGYLKLLRRIRPPPFSGDAVPGLIAALASKDGEIVAIAANDVSAFAEQVPSFDRWPARAEASAAVRPLIAALGPLIDRKPNDAATSDPVVAIAEALGRLAPDTPSSEEAVGALARVLRAGDTRRRVAAATALGRFHPGNVLFTTLSDLIGERDLVVRLAVLGAIHDVHFGAPFVVPKSLGAALEDASAEVRTAAASALWRAGLGIDPYVPALLRHAEHDADARVREVCSGSLQHLRPPQVTAEVLPDLIKSLTSPDARLRLVASDVLAALGPAAAPAVPALIRSIGEPAASESWANPTARAAEALGRIAPRTSMAEKAIAALIAALQAKESEPKIAAVQALAHFGAAAAPAVPDLDRIMNESRARKDDWLAICSAETLTKVGSDDVAASAKLALRDLAEHGNDNVRAIATSKLNALNAGE